MRFLDKPVLDTSDGTVYVIYMFVCTCIRMLGMSGMRML